MTYEDVLSFCEEQDVRFIRLSYFDIYGRQKNVSMKCIVIYSYFQIQIR